MTVEEDEARGPLAAGLISTRSFDCAHHLLLTQHN